MTQDLIRRDALRERLLEFREMDKVPLFGGELECLLTGDVFGSLDAAQPILCRTCRWMETVYRDDDSLNAYDRCGMVLNPVYPQRVDPDRFGCVCHEVQP